MLECNEGMVMGHQPFVQSIEWKETGFESVLWGAPTARVAMFNQSRWLARYQSTRSLG